MLQAEYNANEDPTTTVLGNLIHRLASQEMSILHVLDTKTGIIHINEDERSWIERVCLASLVRPTDQKFIRADSSLAFDLDSIQSQMIRTYLLLCRINYRHIIQKYQCYQLPQPKDTSASITNGLDLDQRFKQCFTDEQLDRDWSHLKTTPLDKLHSGHALLRQIAMTVQNQADLDATMTNLFGFVASMISRTIFNND